MSRSGSRARFFPTSPNQHDFTCAYWWRLWLPDGRRIDTSKRKARPEALQPDDKSLAAERMCGAVLSHRDWMAADTARARLQQQWSELFREWDVVLCPLMPTRAFPHDHSMPYSARRIEIDGKEYPYFDQLVWPGIATTPGLPATAVPLAELAARVYSIEAVDAAQKLFDSRDKLFREGALARKQVDEAQVAYTQARSQYEQAQQHLSALQSVGKREQIRSKSNTPVWDSGERVRSTPTI